MNLLNEEYCTKRQLSLSVGVRKTAAHQSSVTFQTYGIYADCKRSERLLKTSGRDAHVVQTIALLSPLICSKNTGKEFLV